MSDNALIAPSILAADFGYLMRDIKKIENNADYLHIDVMDGHYVNNISFGIPVIEAQKAGCPVVAQEYSSIPEIIGSKGLMVKHASGEQMAAAMSEIVLELKSRTVSEIIIEGIENAKRFSWEKTYEQVKNVYRQIIL